MRGGVPLEFLLMLGLILCIPVASHAQLQAGAAKRIITPESPVYLAGLGNGRLSSGVHDPLFARAVVFDDGATRLGIVSLDLIGLLARDAQDIQARLRRQGSEADHVILTCTHVHSGPDTLGIWGPNEWTSGVNPDYMAFLKEQIVDCVLEAERNGMPARLRLGQATVAEGISWNARAPGLIDRDLGLMQFVTLDGRSIANVINFTAHPEVLWSDNHLLTADYVAPVYREVDRKLQGITLFVNGALGGMVTVDNRNQEGEDQHTFAEAERIGKTVAQATIEAARHAQQQTDSDILFRHAKLSVPMENPSFRALADAGVLPQELSEGGAVETEVNVIQVGDAQIATFPGEALPRLGLEVKGAMTATYKFVFGLANDELGYILAGEDFGEDLYEYERSMSVGSEIGPATRNKILELLGSLD